MQQIINFLIKEKNFILFLLLLILSVFFTVQSNSYHKTKFINSANWLSGGIYSKTNSISDYFHLKEDNIHLVEENKRLRHILFNGGEVKTDSIILDSSHITKYRFTDALVIKNSYSKQNNYLTINKGKKHGVKQDMGVISYGGVVGIIENTSNGYSVIQSILNTLSKVNAKLKKSNHFGTLTWDGNDPHIVQLTDIPGIAPVKVGDSIISGGMSTIFPENILIGTVQSFELDASGNYYTLQVKLFNDMTSINHVFIIENLNKEEIQELENSVDE
ncbi:rod shape-determining protein MreC [Abyssalbus ytuae]|uniref:Cell shape-determining protein MreC n=1 Tax=Abyssalbus ytuae TaxID=2926907 RepID=A0A9E6ZQM6_9FLAO|nr:rod shape-determining protein MreC [Abyssalbus ytuae]UOB18710.1 rod shape-determining protein MreC [Abyssalbus ytuae]